MARAKSLGEQLAKEEPYQRFRVDDLFFDAKNPRLAEYGIDEKTTQSDLLKIHWQKMAIEEVAMSIAYNGYFVHEPLFIEEHGKNLSSSRVTGGWQRSGCCWIRACASG
jgi:hypothetical protein